MSAQVRESERVAVLHGDLRLPESGGADRQPHLLRARRAVPLHPDPRRGILIDQIRAIDRKIEVPHDGAMCDLMWSDPDGNEIN